MKEGREGGKEGKGETKRYLNLHKINNTTNDCRVWTVLQGGQPPRSGSAFQGPSNC